MYLSFTLLLLVLTTASVSAIPLEDFYPFGNTSGDRAVPRHRPDLCGIPPVVPISTPFLFYGTNYTFFRISTLGYIDFHTRQFFLRPLCSPPIRFPSESSDIVVVAPFWSAVSIYSFGSVWYRETTSQPDRDRVQREIRATFPGASSFTPRMVFITTWDHVGSFAGHITNRTNTFQCILATDGFMSFVIFLYADGLIQWGDLAGFYYAQIGANAGDGVNFISHEYSLTPQVINITASRVPADTVMVDGMLVYKVDGGNNCDNSNDAKLSLLHHFGHQLGGTPVLVTGLCVEPGFIFCTFDGRTGDGVFVNRGTVLCIPPIMSTQGTVNMGLINIRRKNVRITPSGTYITVPCQRAYQVGLSIDGKNPEMQLYLEARDIVTLTWLPDKVLPFFLTSNVNIRLNIQMFQQHSDLELESDWISIEGTLVSDIENTGSFDYKIPDGLTLASCLRQDMLCPVVFRVSVVRGTRVNVTGAGEVRLEGFNTPEAGIWSGMAYLQSDDADPAKLSQLCEDWADSAAACLQRNTILDSRLRLLPACPPTQRQAAFDRRFRQERINSVFSSNIISSNYEENFMKFFTPSASTCYLQVAMDAKYNDLRPSKYSNEPTYVLPIPALGGVNRTVEFQVNQRGGLDILVDGTTVDFSGMSEQNFQQVVVIDEGNNTGIAEFSGGSNIEIRVENGIISVMLVTLPSQYRGLTRGLMGNYNNKTLDDFIKKGSTAAMPLDSSNEEIFEFGNTWLLVEPSESLFAYNREGESFGVFSDSSFTPAFEPEFENPELEQRAKEVCGNDQSCLFDIAATKNENIGMATMISINDFEEIVDLAKPIVCVPGCGEGVCVATNSCACAVGYTGERCTQRILSACEQEMCQNNGTCVQHVRSFTCTCPEGFIGIFCQEKEPPLSLKLINSSPRTFRNITFLDFIPSKPLKSARCILNNTETDCTSGRVRFNDLSPGYHSLLINATSNTEGEAILRRNIFVCAANSGSCGVNLINEGVSVTGDCVLFQFTACGPVQSYSCSIDNEIFKPCLSPLRYCGLAQSQHRLRVQPDGVECEDTGGLTTQFHII